MRIAELAAQHKFRLIDGPIREPGAGEVLVRVSSVGICGSDLHNFSEGAVGDTPSVYPMVLGHEPTGVVHRTGAGVTGWHPGDRAALEPAVYCYHCQYCHAGRHNVCENLKFFSQPDEPGFFRDFVVLPARNLLPLPANIGMREGTLFEPLAVVLHSMEFADPRPGESYAVFGAGPIGLMTLAVLKLSGAARVYVSDPVQHRREMAAAMGADAVFDPKADDVVREMPKVHAAIDCAAKDGSMNQAIQVVRNFGKVVITAIPSEPEPSFKFHDMRRKEVRLYNVRRSNNESEQALHLLGQYPGRFAEMLTHTMPLESIERAFFMLENYDEGVGKISIEVNS